ncbi:alpha/beta hydrolase-fold protein [Umezawaea endophytica]|uniref:Alpha/beta hydrolase-fold protein n=1 Tax=Umezawaea endophytica TaxID=1654476 RepID=A0A9X3AI65_9PSEU|nr:alpha/beta hydrolase-fold protein [Umezawaea endophytica]MCS7482657.1 alpha/beta hydrolase-fold protein [Umezawaea endophytica]
MSDRLARFTAEAEQDLVGATERLRADLADSGGPLVHRLTDDTVRVTFVWIGPERQVSVRAQVFDDPNALSHPMRRVPGTEVWHLDAVVPSDVVACYQYLVDDPFPDADRDDLAELGRLMVAARARMFADPVNPRGLFPQMALVAGERTADRAHWDSVLVLPDAEPVDWFDTPVGERGALTEHRLDDRTVTVYTPPGYRAAETYPLVVLLDGECWPLVADLPAALDNLMGREIAPAVVAMVHNSGGMAARMAEMACDPAFAALLADRVVPFVRSLHTVADRAVVAGNSLGGLAAAHAALTRPDVFEAVLSCSGSHWWGYSGTGWGKDSEPEWLTRQYADAPLLPLRFWLDVGTLETGPSPLSPGVDQRAATRHLRTVLRAKGYRVDYHEAPGGHDFATFRRSTVRGLRALLPA